MVEEPAVNEPEKAADNDNGKSKQKTNKVNKSLPAVENSLRSGEDTQIVWNYNGKPLNGSTITISPSKTYIDIPYNGNVGYYDVTSTQDSTNSSVAVSDDYPDALRVYRYGAGSATITVHLTEDRGEISFKVVCPAASWSLSKTSVSLAKNYDTSSIYIKGDLDGYDIDRVESSNTSVVSAYLWRSSSEIELTRYKPGSATVTVYAEDGSKRTCKVNCPVAPFKLAKTTLAYTKSNGDCTKTVGLHSSSTDSTIKSARSSNSKVAKASVKYGEVEVVANKAGKCVITVKDNRGRTAKLNVRVDKAWVSANLKKVSWCLIPYSSKKVYLQSKPGAKVIFKIKGKKYKKTVGKKGYVYVNLKKHFKLKTKFHVSFKHNGGTAQWTGKVYSNTSLWFRIYKYEKKCEVEVYNVTKGDVVTLKAGGRTYKKKIKKDAKKKTFVIKLKKYGGDIYHVDFKIKNKYKQTLYTWSQDLWQIRYRTIIYV